MQKHLVMLFSCVITHRMCVFPLIDLVSSVDLCADSLPSFVYSESLSSYPTSLYLSTHPFCPSVCTQHVRYLSPVEALIIIPFPLALYFQAVLFHRILLPSLQVSVHSALTIFETEISPWMHPLQWLDENTKHLDSIFHVIVDLTQEANIDGMSFPESMIYQVLWITL
jgi:hypothetical protein